MGIDDMKMLEQKAQQLAAEAEQDKPKPKEKILFVRFVIRKLTTQDINEWLSENLSLLTFQHFRYLFVQ